MPRNPQITILHGWTKDLKNWNPFLKQLRQNGYTYKLLKIPGLTEILNEPWYLDDYVEWLRENLKNEESVVLLGHSFGGHIAISYSALYPHKVKKLILIDSAGLSDNRLQSVVKRFIFLVIAKTGKLFTSSVFLRKALYLFAGEKDYLNASPNLRETMARVIKRDIKTDLIRVTIPTLIIWGEKDRITHLSHARVFHEKIKNSQLHVIKKARHAPQFSHSKQVIEIIGHFIQ